MELSVEVGKLVAKRALEKGIKEVYFDRELPFFREDHLFFGFYIVFSLCCKF